MPTGYTCDVQTGKVTDFQTFALQCARAFGALILMRDEPMDAPIPEAFQPSSYHHDEIRKDTERLVKLRGMTPVEADTAARAAHDEAFARWEERKAGRAAEKLRYEAMLTKVQAWQPPSPDHVEYKHFMVQQLTSSIDFDCSDKYDDPPPFETGEVWRARQIRETERSIEYHRQDDREEIERTEKRNLWVRQLRDSLANQQELSTR